MIHATDELSSVRRPALLALVSLGLAALLSFTPSARAQGNPPARLPLSDFLDAQGNHDVWYPPEPALFAWSGPPPDYPRMGWMDYAGAADRWLVSNGGTSIGTQVTGTFTKRMVGDNLAEYTATVHARNALAWCVRALDAGGNWDGATMLFGAHAYEVLAGATPALGECHFTVSWEQAADAPIADVNLAANYGDPYRPEGWRLLRTSFRGTAFGPLHEASGLGVEGAPGSMVISQVNSLPQAFGHGNGNADGFPAEVMDLHAVGRN